MRKIDRFRIPELLERRGPEWTRKFIESGKTRPNSGQYGHEEIRSDLMAMSHSKCYYCESALKNMPTEVDHYIEVSELPQLSFLWENLYLSCENCNNKISNLRISVLRTLDPCFHDDTIIEQNLIFKDEIIDYIPESSLGEITIIKYKLDSALLDYLRSKELQKFYKLLIITLEKCNSDGGRSFSNLERELLLSFSKNNKPYTLMFKTLFKANPF